jgi:hypothetical protein
LLDRLRDFVCCFSLQHSHRLGCCAWIWASAAGSGALRRSGGTSSCSICRNTQQGARTVHKRKAQTGLRAARFCARTAKMLIQPHQSRARVCLTKFACRKTTSLWVCASLRPSLCVPAWPPATLPGLRMHLPAPAHQHTSNQEQEGFRHACRQATRRN